MISTKGGKVTESLAGYLKIIVNPSQKQVLHGNSPLSTAYTQGYFVPLRGFCLKGLCLKGLGSKEPCG